MGIACTAETYMQGIQPGLNIQAVVTRGLARGISYDLQ